MAAQMISTRLWSSNMKQKKFREDLFYRLNVVNLEIPPLRDRTGDVPKLAQHFLEKFAGKNRKEIKGFTPTAMDALSRYKWPGNVRELENSIERAVILCMGQFISEKELLPDVLKEYNSGTAVPPAGATIGGRPLNDVEIMAIRETLEQTGGNKSKAAKILNITRTTLNNKLKKYGLA